QIILKACIPEGHDVFVADSGEKGLEMFKEVSPHLILLDLTMRGMSGFDVLEEIRGMDDNVAIVIITADTQSKTKEKAFKLGATNILKKPPKVKEIQRHLSGV
ncbi:hypothetical protein LCGC14_2220150, partial [marine sediment metagenome]